MKTYSVNVRRSGAWWAIDVADLPGVFSQARRLDQAKGMARDAIASFLDVPADSFDVTVRPELEKGVNDVVVHAQVAKGDAIAYQAKASAAQRKAVRELTARGYTTRDIGDLLDISHQRVAQLVTH